MCVCVLGLSKHVDSVLTFPVETIPWNTLGWKLQRYPCACGFIRDITKYQHLVNATGRRSIMRCGWLAGANFVWENNTADLMWVMQHEVVTYSVLSPPTTRYWRSDIYSNDEKWRFLKITPIFFWMGKEVQEAPRVGGWHRSRRKYVKQNEINNSWIKITEN